MTIRRIILKATDIKMSIQYIHSIHHCYIINKFQYIIPYTYITLYSIYCILKKIFWPYFILVNFSYIANNWQGIIGNMMFDVKTCHLFYYIDFVYTLLHPLYVRPICFVFDHKYFQRRLIDLIKILKSL